MSTLPTEPASPRVVLASGHMVDAPDRTTPRFPPSEVGRVADRGA